MSRKTFCTYAEAKSIETGVRAGYAWTVSELITLEQLIKAGRYTIADVAAQLKRTSWAIICKATSKNILYMNTQNETYFFIVEDNEMTTGPNPARVITDEVRTPIIETRVFIKGKDASLFSDEAIFEVIADLEARIFRANNIGNKPKRLVDLIQKTQADIDALVQYVDNR